jgi:hypothetical protein
MLPPAVKPKHLKEQLPNIGRHFNRLSNGYEEESLFGQTITVYAMRITQRFKVQSNLLGIRCLPKQHAIFPVNEAIFRLFFRHPFLYITLSK